MWAYNNNQVEKVETGKPSGDLQENVATEGFERQRHFERESWVGRTHGSDMVGLNLRRGV